MSSVDVIQKKLTDQELKQLEDFFVGIHTHKDPELFCHAEINKLKRLVMQFGTQNWKDVSKEMNGRTPKQCREAYLKYHNTNINGPWTKEEDDLLIEKYKEFGSKWLQIQQYFPDRTDTNLKNRWICLLRKPGLIEIIPCITTPIIDLADPYYPNYERTDETLFWN